MVNNLGEALSSEYCFIKCGAMWCGSCKQMDKIIKDNHLDTFMDEQKIDYFYVDADNEDNEVFLDTYNIKCLPTILLFQKGKLFKLLKGIQTPDVIKKEISLLKTKAI